MNRIVTPGAGMDHPAVALVEPSPGRAPDGLLSVVSPVYGCAGCLEDLVERVRAAVAPTGMALEIVLVDDASPDGAWTRILELARLHPDVRGLRLSRNFGQHYAIAAGIEHARGDWIAVMDCDLQDPPEELPRLLHAACERDVVFAQRLQRQDGAFKRFGSWAFYRMLGWLTEVDYDHSIGNFGVYSRKVIDTLNAMPERARFFPLMVKWTGYRSVSVPVAHAQRQQGRSSYSLRKLLRLGLDVVLSYSDKPLRLVVKLGLAFSLVSLCFVAYSVLRYLQGDIAVAGFTSVIASIWLIGSVTIFSIGVAGLYIGRLFNDTKRRPYYLLDEDTRPRAPAH